MTVTVVNDIVGITFRAAWWTVGTLTANQNLSDVSVHRTWHSLCHSVSLNCWRHCRETYVDDSFIFVLLWVDNDVCVLCTKLLYNHEKGGLGFSHCYFLFIYLFVCISLECCFFFFLKVNYKNKSGWVAWQWSLLSLVLFCFVSNNINGQSFIGICPWACAAKWIRWRGSLTRYCQPARSVSNVKVPGPSATCHRCDWRL